MSYMLAGDLLGRVKDAGRKRAAGGGVPAKGIAARVEHAAARVEHRTERAADAAVKQHFRQNYGGLPRATQREFKGNWAVYLSQLATYVRAVLRGKATGMTQPTRPATLVPNIAYSKREADLLSQLQQAAATQSSSTTTTTTTTSNGTTTTDQAAQAAVNSGLPVSDGNLVYLPPGYDYVNTNDLAPADPFSQGLTPEEIAGRRRADIEAGLVPADGTQVPETASAGFAPTNPWLIAAAVGAIVFFATRKPTRGGRSLVR